LTPDRLSAVDVTKRSRIIGGVADRDGGGRGDDRRVFRALADSSRRLLLDLLYERDGRTLTELCEQLEMTRFGTMKHLRLLEEASLVTTRRVGREKLHFLNPVPIRLIHDRWIGKYAESRVATMAALKAVLEGESRMSEQVRVAAPAQVYHVFIKASPEQIWDAITKPEFTVRYFYGSAVDTDLEPGGKFWYHAPDRSELWGDGKVLESHPPRRLVITWHALWSEETAAEEPSRVTWEIEPQEGGYSKLTVVHDELDRSPITAQQVSGEGWMLVLSGLKTVVETGSSLR
jgi:uncharacterized protein YndB with AHSA1/START domain